MSVAANMLKKFSDIHPLPQIVTIVNNLVADPESTIKDFEDVIKHDPVLVARLLTLVQTQSRTCSTNPPKTAFFLKKSSGYTRQLFLFAQK